MTTISLLESRSLLVSVPRLNVTLAPSPNGPPPIWPDGNWNVGSRAQVSWPLTFSPAPDRLPTLEVMPPSGSSVTNAIVAVLSFRKLRPVGSVSVIWTFWLWPSGTTTATRKRATSPTAAYGVGVSAVPASDVLTSVLTGAGWSTVTVAEASSS